jgi:hypothetical protein
MEAGEELAGGRADPEERLDLDPKARVVTTGLGQKGFALGRLGDVPGPAEDVLDVTEGLGHAALLY